MSLTHVRKRLLAALTLLLAAALSLSLMTARAAHAATVRVPQPRKAIPDLIRRVRIRETIAAIRIYTVHSGDTLSAIAARFYGSATKWPGLWWANRSQDPNPNLILTGQRLTVPTTVTQTAWITMQALHAIPAPKPVFAPPPPPAPPVAATAARTDGDGDTDGDTSDAPQQVSTPAPSGSYTVVAAGNGFQACVIRAESGGNPNAQNPSSTASGLYGFLDTTWTAVTGLPGPARDYSVATQDAAFWKLYSEAGTAPWAPYDGC